MTAAAASLGWVRSWIVIALASLALTNPVRRSEVCERFGPIFWRTFLAHLAGGYLGRRLRPNPVAPATSN